MILKILTTHPVAMLPNEAPMVLCLREEHLAGAVETEHGVRVGTWLIPWHNIVQVFYSEDQKAAGTKSKK